MADWLDALERLQKLRLAGVLTAEEFESEKRKLLGLPEPASKDATLNAELAALARLKKLRDDSVLTNEEYELERLHLTTAFTASTKSANAGFDLNRTAGAVFPPHDGFSTAIKRPQKTSGPSPVAISSIIVVAIALAGAGYVRLHPEILRSSTASVIGQMTVLPNKLNCRSKPETSSIILSRLKFGQKVTVVANASGWSRLDGTVGDCWVPSKFLGQVEAEPIPVPKMASVNSSIQAVAPKITGDWQDDKTAIIDGWGTYPTFAGRYVIITEGCGAGCTYSIVGDHQTGNLYKLGLGGEDQMWLNLKYANNSNIINADWNDFETCFWRDYKWVGSSLEPSGTLRTRPRGQGPDGCVF
jgi:hypothetical protein